MRPLHLGGLVCWALATGCVVHDVAAVAPFPYGTQHEAGSTQVEARVHYGVPILQKSFFWDGNGEVDDTGIGLHVSRFIADDVALGLGTNLVTWWTPGSDVYSADLEGLLRVYPVHAWPFFIDGITGFQYASDQIPPGGTVWNFTFGFGGGLDLSIDDHTSLMIGTLYHHISNALGRMNDRNPSQNETRFWVGIAWTL
ncbi:MAG TPA: hypothetical protein VFZ65_12475 [Planctomycetota bacterium]|nr:hypothetical protein [Planctomycetota bacterium]